jgi:hypothetical protein
MEGLLAGGATGLLLGLAVGAIFAAIEAATAGTAAAVIVPLLTLLIGAAAAYAIANEIVALIMDDMCPDERHYRIGFLIGNIIGALAGGAAAKGLGGRGGGAGRGGEPVEEGCPSCGYEDTTTGNSVPNRTTDVTRSDFEQNLRDSGYNESVSKDGKVSNFDNGTQRYSVRDYSNSGPPTAEFFPNGSGKATLKIRLGP